MIATNDIDQAQREAAKDRAHEMCIDKIMELDKLNNTLKQTINGLLDLDDQRLRKIEALKAKVIRLQDMYNEKIDQNVFSTTPSGRLIKWLKTCSAYR